MSEITIQQTLKITNGKISPSTQPIDGDLIEVSKEPNNAIEVKPDGLYVKKVSNTGGSTPPTSNTNGGEVISTFYIDQNLVKTEGDPVVLNTRRYNCPISYIHKEYVANLGVPLFFLEDFKTISSLYFTTNTIGMTPEGQPEIAFTQENLVPILKGPDGRLHAPVDIFTLSYQLQSFSDISFKHLEGLTEGSTYIATILPANLKKWLASVNGIEVPVSSYGNLKYLSESLKLGDVVVVSFVRAGTDFGDSISEDIEYVIGEDPSTAKINIYRAPFVDLTESLSYTDITIKGVLA